MDKKLNKKTVLLIIILLFILILVLGIFVFKTSDVQENEYTGTMDLENMKQALSDNEYYIFEDNDQKYILFKIVESVYVPDEIVIESADIINKDYNDDNKLDVTIDVKTNITRRQISQAMSSDGKTKDSRYFTLKIDNECTGLVVNGEEYSKFTGGIVHSTSTNKYGYINEEGKLTLPVEYDNISELENYYYNEQTNEEVEIDYSNYLKIYKENTGTGIALKDGNILIDAIYSSILNFGENTFAVTKGDNNQAQLGIIDINGNIVKEYINGGIFDDSEVFNKYEVISLNGKNGVVNRNLEIIVPIEYDSMDIETSEATNELGKYEEYYFIGKNGDVYTIMDEEANTIIDSSYESIYDLINKYGTNVNTENSENSENINYNINSILSSLNI